METIKNNPVVTSATLVGAIMSVVAFLVVSGTITWSPDMVSAFEAMMISLVPLILSGGVALWPRSKVDGPATVEQKDIRIKSLESKVRVMNKEDRTAKVSKPAKPESKTMSVV